MRKIFSLKNKKGFTLIELMIVVAIIGILSAIAIPNFISFRLKAKTSEAKSNLGAIRSCQETYKTETELYRDCTASPRASTAVNELKIAWVDNGGYAEIGFDPKGDVWYAYAVSGSSATAFTATATGDLNGNGTVASYTISAAGGAVNSSSTTEY